MNSITEKLKQFLAPLSPAQRTLFFGLIVAILVLVGTVFYWALRPNYTLLFGSLEQESAQQITQELDNQGIEYKLENGGQAIYVHDDKVDELRLELAPMGAPKSDMKGYELFDSNSLGMTDYMQQLNNRRALEGELSRSVNTLEQVKSSRVHLVLPERSPFEQASVKASASVLLTLKSGERLKKQQVEGITSLIAGSVEGLDAKDITIVDHAGNRLTNTKGQDGLASEGSWLKSERKTESYLAERGQSMLDRVLGPGNSIVRVAVEQNFDSLVRRSNNIDPTSRTLISEQRSEETHTQEGSEIVPIDEFTPVEDRGETAVTSNNEEEVSSRTRNYEVSETKEVFKKAPGEISNISASVLLNYKQVKQTGENGETVWQSEPYSEEELEEFREVLGSALGIQPERGDRITIKQVEFWNPRDISPGGEMIENPWPWSRVLRWAIIFITLGIIVWLLNSLRKRSRMGQEMVLGTSFKGGGAQTMFADSTGGENLEEMDEDELQELMDSDENQEVPALEEKNYDLEEIVNLVELKPSKAAKVVRAILITNDE